MSVFLTPELKPFFGGTYFPPRDGLHGVVGFPSLLQLIAKKWQEQSMEIRTSSERMLESFRRATQYVGGSVSESTKPDVARWIKSALGYFVRKFDEEHGGFGGAPKFPTPVNLSFLLNIVKLCRELPEIKTAVPKTVALRALGLEEDGSDSDIHSVEQRALGMVRKTLVSIWRGGIHDHVGMGIHRYSVDRQWHLPHFEKMLYDQGQLLGVYGEALKLDASEESKKMYRLAIDDISSYVRNCLRDAECGGLFCAEDADSYPTTDADKKLEGAFAVWMAQEINAILPPFEAALFKSHYGVEEEGNVPRQYDHHGELVRKNVLMAQRSVEETASLFQIDGGECERKLQKGLEALASVRSLRPKPHLDDKILVSWNALAMSGLCKAYEATQDAALLGMAEATAGFIRREMMREGQLRRVFRNGPSSIPAMAVDYAFLTRACLDLWSVSLKGTYLEWGLQLQKTANDLFWDHESAGFFSTRADAADIQLRLKDIQDGAEPSVNSVMASNLLHLHLITGDDTLKMMLDRMKSVFAKEVDGAPFARPAFLSTLVEELLDMTKVSFVVPAGMKEEPLKHDTVAAMKAIVDRRTAKVFTVEARDDAEEMIQVVLCKNHVCQAPVSSPAELQKLITP